MFTRALALLGLLVGIGTGDALASAQARLVAKGFASPVFATAPDGDARLFVVEQGGRIKVLDPRTGGVRGTPFLNVRNIVSGGEQGLLGLAFHPNYAANGYFYVYVTRAPDGATEIRRYRVSTTDANVADPTSETVILAFSRPFANHNGGWLGFGPDGFLYASSGDGGSGNDPGNNAQNTNSLLGKILRLDVDHPSGGRAYGIPAGNPFAGGGGAGEVWDYGLRNSWRCSFDRLTGDLWIGDVGQSAREEVDVHRAGEAGGKNFGWRAREGTIATPGLSDPTPSAAVSPVHEYSHAVGQSITGGYVCRFADAGDLAGRYLFGDFVSGRIWTFQLVNGAATALRERTQEITPDGGIPNLSSFAEDASGQVYAITIDGLIYRIVGGDHPRPRLKLTGSRARTTAEGRVVLRGTASSPDRLARVTYQVDGAKKALVARGKARWTIRLPLRTGVNRLVIRAVDAYGFRSQPIRVVIRRSGGKFG